MTSKDVSASTSNPPPVPPQNTDTTGIPASEATETKKFAKKLRGVELFATGTWSGDTYNDSDLDAMVSAFHSLPIKVPVKIGHDEAQRWWNQKDGMPALGWVENVRRVGGKLVGDLDAVPDPVYGLIEEKRYRKVSAEIYWNYRDDDGRTWPRALKAVSLLGADLPAVTSLADLQTALHSDDRQVKVYDQKAESVRDYGIEKKEESTMDEKQYTEKIASLESQLNTERKNRDDWETRALKAESTLAQRDEEFAVRQFREVTLPGLKKEGKVLPAEEETLCVMFTSLAPGVKKYAGQEVNPREMFLKSLSDRQVKVNFKESGSGGEEDPRDGETSAAAVDRTIKKFMEKGEAKNYNEGKELLKLRHPNLWARYIRNE